MGQAETRDGFPCWIDLGARDVDAALAFYAAVIGWEAGERSGDEYGGYAMWFRDGIPAAGIGPLSEGAQPAWTTYLATTDIDATLGAVTRAGGHARTPAMVVGPLGRMAVVMEPQGGVFGFWEARDFPGFTRYAEPGHLDWCIARSTDPRITADFLASVFPYESQQDDSAGDGYVELCINRTPALGVMPATDEPSSWMAYFAVDDADAAVAHALTAGGRIIRHVESTPYGRIATLADPEGASFSVISS